VTNWQIAIGIFTGKLRFLSVCPLRRSVNLKSIFSWNSIAPKTNEIFDKILPYEAKAEFFVRFLGNGVSRKIAFEIYWPLVWVCCGMQHVRILWIIISKKPTCSLGIDHSKNFHSQILPKDPLMKYEHNAVAQQSLSENEMNIELEKSLKT
jgi:hypothetical protein